MNVSAATLGQLLGKPTSALHQPLPEVLDFYLPNAATDGDRQQRMAAVTTLIYNWTAQIQGLQSQKSQLQGNIANWQYQQQAQQGRSGNLAQQMNSLDYQLGELGMEKQRVMERLHCTQVLEERQELENRRYALDSQIDSLQSARGTAYYGKADADSQVANLGQQIGYAQNQMASINDQLSTLNTQLYQAQQEQQQLRGW